MLTDFVTKLLTLILGYAVPAHECVQSIELLPTRSVELRFWCQYWIIVNIWYTFDEITDALASRIPMYREFKLAFIIYLSFPTTKGADIVYKTIFRPVMMLIMLCEWNIKWRLLPHLCETLDRSMCRALHWLLFRGDVHRSSRSSLPKVTGKNAEDIRSVRHPSSSSSSEVAAIAEWRREDSQRARPRSPADELVEAARGGAGGEDMNMMPHRRRSVNRHLWGMETYENKVHHFVESYKKKRRGYRDSLLCIWGKRGVGKSALLRLVRDSYAGGTSFHHVLFVGAGDTGGCTVHNVQHAIASSLGLDLPKMSLLGEWSRAEVIFSSLIKRDERALLLVDDVREPFEVELLGLPISLPGQYKIICATRSRTVCAEMKTGHIIEMRCLGEDDAWNLFKDKVGIVDAQTSAHPHVHQLAKQMVAECRGLPLALCVLGRAMSSKTDPREWRNAYNLLKAKYSQKQQDEGYSCLDILENELKDSFLVTSLWPKDGSIPTEPMRIRTRNPWIMYQEDSSTKDEIVQVSQKKKKIDEILEGFRAS